MLRLQQATRWANPVPNRQNGARLKVGGHHEGLRQFRYQELCLNWTRALRENVSHRPQCFLPPEPPTGYLRVDEGNTITDFDEEEAVRKMSITSSLAAMPWQKTKINVIDTPGYNLFLNDTKSALLAADAALVLLDGVAGVEVSTEKVWNFAEERSCRAHLW